MAHCGFKSRSQVTRAIQELVQAEKAARSRTSFEELEEKLRQRKIRDQELKAELEQSAAKEPKTWSL